MDFKDRRIWYAVAAVIIVLIIVGYAPAGLAASPWCRSSKPASAVEARCAARCRALAALHPWMRDLDESAVAAARDWEAALV